MRLLLRLYPRAWRDRYGEEFDLVLRATPPGPRMVLDVVAGALDARLRAIRRASVLRTVLLVLAAAVVGWLNFHATDDVQPVAAALLVFGFGFGLHRPGRAWWYALVLFAAVPVSQGWADAAAYHPELTRAAPYETVVALIPAALGASVGAGLRLASRAGRT